MIDVYDMALAGLLHDVGKVMQRAEVEIGRDKYEEYCPTYKGVPSHQHVMWTRLFFDSLLSKPGRDWERIANLAASHHNASAFANQSDPEYWLIQCLINADRVSANWDRPDEDEVSPRGAYKKKELLSIFTDVFLGNPMPEQLALPLMPSEASEAVFPRQPDPESLKCKEYMALYEGFRVEFGNLLNALGSGMITLPNLVDATESLLEKYFWSVPSNTMEETPTNSLFHHSRITAGIASVLYNYFAARPEEREQLKNLDKSGQEILLLIGGDLSGIQSYIFDLHPEHSKKAAKTLRARSFKIKTLCDIALQRICRELGLPRQCILINAGGKFMLLAPNLPEVEARMEKIRDDTEREFFRHFMGSVSLNLDWSLKVPFGAMRSENFPDTLDSFIERIEDIKLRKYSSYLHEQDAWQSDRFLIEQNNYYSNLCPQCGKRTVKENAAGELPNCSSCEEEVKLGQILPSCRHFIIAKGQPRHDAALSMFDDTWYLEPYNPRQGAPLKEDDFAFCVREAEEDKTLPLPYKPVASNVPIYKNLQAGDAELIAELGESDEDEETASREQHPLTFDDLSLLTLEKTAGGKYKGVPLNAVLKGDVDSLGNIFSLGLRYGRDSKQKPKGFSVTQYATLSAGIDWFFSAYLPKLIQSDERFRNRIYVVYAGGDDFCLIGPWNLMLDLAVELDKKFHAFCGQHPDLHFSAALRLVHGKAPIRFGVEKTDADLELAKKWKADPRQEHYDKNALHLFDTTVPWNKMPEVLDWADNFDKWLGERESGERGSSGFSTQFLYRLLQYSAMACSYHKSKDRTGKNDVDNIRDLLYKSYLTYDLKRNFDKDKDPGQVEKLQKLAWDDEQIRMMKVPINKTLYKNRKYIHQKGDHNE